MNTPAQPVARALDDLDSPTAERLRGLNRLLGRIYGDQVLISTLLLRRGHEEDSIAVLKRRFLDRYLGEFTAALVGFFTEVLSANRCLVLRRRYGLEGRTPPTLAEVGRELGVSRERVRQLQVTAVRRLRSRLCRERIEGLADAVARSILERGISPSPGRRTEE